jgi:dynein heavy chain 1, cytosolic
VEDVLTKRVEAAVTAWTAAFATTATTSTSTDSSTAAAAAATAAGATATATTAGAHSLQLQPSVHEVLLRNGVLHLSPPLEQARHTWIRHLHTHVSTAALLPRLRSSRFAVFDEHDVSRSSSSTGTTAAAAGAADKYAEAVMKRLPVTVLQAAYTEIEAQLGRVGEYVGLWLRYQSLWDVTTQVRLPFTAI